MKKSFLLLLLMTLLPLASWAVEVSVGAYTVTLDKQFVVLTDPTTGVDAPDAQLTAGGDVNTKNVYNKAGKKVEGKIKEAGEYYFLITTTPEGSPVIKVPFYVVGANEVVEKEIVFNEGTYTNSKVYEAYLKASPWSYVWDVDGNKCWYPTTTGDDRKAEWEALDKTKFTYDFQALYWGYPDNTNLWADFPTFGIVNPEGEHGKVVVFVGGDYRGAIDFNAAGAAPFFLASVNEFWPQPSQGAANNIYGLPSPAEQNPLITDLKAYYQSLTPSINFDEDYVQFFVLPASFDAAGSFFSGEVQVQPQSGVEMPWGGEIDMSPEHADKVITLTPIELNTVEGLKEAIITKLKVNEAEALKTLAPGATTTYSLGLIDETDKQVAVNGITYLIAPVLDAQVVIGSAKNKFAVDETTNLPKLPELKTGLVYNGAEQSLIKENTGTAALGTKIEYYVSETALVATEGVYPIAETAWSTVAEGKDAGTYYVYARPAAAEGADEGKWTAGDAVLLKEEVVDGATEDPKEFATIAKATPTIEWTDKSSVAEVYYQIKFTDGKVTITPTGAKVMYKNAAGQDVELEGAEVYYSLRKGTTILQANPTSVNVTTQNGTGDFSISAYFSVDPAYPTSNEAFAKNFNNVGAEAVVPKAEFTVKNRPDVTITPKSPQLIGQGTDPVFENDTIWEDGEKGNLTGTAQYSWYYDNNGELGNYVYAQHPAAGEYWVTITGGLSSTTHNVIYGKLKVVVTSGDIEADIADATLIYGQPLPLKLKHTTGLAEANVSTFENQEYTNGEFTATLIDATTKKPILDNDGKEQKTQLYAWTREGTRLYTALPVGTYKVTAEIATLNTNNPWNQNPTNGFTVTVDEGEWTINPKDIKNEDTGTQGIYVYGLGNEFNYSKEYAGEAILPTAAELNAGRYGISYRFDKLTFDTEDADGNLVEGDLEVKAIEGKNNINAGEAWFRIEGKGNFTGYKDMQFTITKATVAVRPAAEQTWTVGTPEVNEDGTSKYLLDVAYINEQLKGQDKTTEAVPATETAAAIPAHTGLNIATAEGFRKLAVKRICSTTVGNHNGGLKAYKTDEGAENEEFATNYNFTFRDANADLAIEPGTINLKVKDVEVTYAGKTVKPAIEYGFELAEGTTLSDLMKKDGNWQRLITGLNSADIKWVRNDEIEGATAMEYNAATYANFFGCDMETVNLKATNYTVTVTDNQGDLIIAPAQITLKAADQGPMALEAVENGGFNASPVLGDNATVVVTGDIFDPITDIVESIEKPAVVKAGENTLTLVTKTNGNYNYPTPATGILYVGAQEGEPLVLALTSNMDDYEETSEIKATVTTKKAGDWSKLKAYEGVDVDKITLQLKPASMEGKPAFSEWNADEWHAMVLPFEISVKELSQAFDYAYVNLVDAAATTEKNVQFRLANILDVIPANTPFCIKSSVPYQYATADEEAQTIEFIPAKGKKFTIDLTGVDENWLVEGEVADAKDYGYKFSGTYKETFDIDKTLSYLRFLNNKWYFIKKDSEKTYIMPPYTGFVNLTEANASRDITFTFEEADGSTTAIKAIDFFSGNNANVEGWFSVSGMKMNGAPTQKGTYIQNGKKVLVK